MREQEQPLYDIDAVRKLVYAGTATPGETSYVAGYVLAIFEGTFAESEGRELIRGDVPVQVPDAGLYVAGWEQAVRDVKGHV